MQPTPLPKISVIVPIYKVEPYLRQCADSVLAQTYTNLEVILVDDGSPDGCGDICDAYAAKDSRVVVIHKENGGVSDARNAGLDRATGAYISFVDGDDWIAPDLIETLYSNSVAYDADISSCKYFLFYANTTTPRSHRSEIVSLNSEQAVRDILAHSGGGKGKLDLAPTMKLYRKGIFNSIRYPSGKRYEDAFVILDVLAAAERVVVDCAPRYHYRQRKGSIMNTIGYSAAKMDRIEAHALHFKVIQERHPDLLDAGRIWWLRLNIHTMTLMALYGGRFRRIPEYRTVSRTIRENLGFILRSTQFSKEQKTAAVLLRINVSLFQWAALSYKRLRKRRAENQKVLFD